MTSPSDPSQQAPWTPVAPLDPFAGREPEVESSPLEFDVAARARLAVEHVRERAFTIRLDRASAAFVMGDERRARQWINDAAAAAGIPEPWPELGRPAQAHRFD